MRITTIEYRRLVSTGDYSNLTIGAVAQVDVDWEESDEANVGQANEALTQLEQWVNGQLALRTETEQAQEILANRRWEAQELERKLAAYRERYKAALEFFERVGIKPPSGWPSADDLPF